MSGNRLSLAQQIALLDAAPTDVDPEDLVIREDRGEGLPDAEPGVREHYFEVGPSTLRQMHDSLSDPKYEGTKVSRKQLMEQDYEQSEEEDEEEEAEEEEEEESPSNSEAGSESDDELGNTLHPMSSHTEDEEEDEQEETEEPLTKPQRTEASSTPLSGPAEDLSTALRRKRDEDYEKGKAVSRQLGLWDSLLDARIRLQKPTIAINRIPKALDLKEYASLPDCGDAIKHMLAEATSLSEEIFRLQEHILSSNESIELPARKRRRLDGDRTVEDYHDWVEEATDDLFSLEASYHPHLVQTLGKWSAKVQAVSPSILLPSSRGAFASKNAQKPKSVLQILDEVLVDHDKLLARTRVKRNEVKRLGQTEEAEGAEEGDPDLFDDTDFYQQMLRDVIESKGEGSHGEDWMTVQKQKKAKKKVDTKASKGRKLRYEVHEKLQNFMMPVPTVGGWHEEQIDELFASLLGKGFESGPSLEDTQNEAVGRFEDVQVKESLEKGFRVFG